MGGPIGAPLGTRGTPLGGPRRAARPGGGTFRRGFNNSPTRDKTENRFFSFFSVFWPNRGTGWIYGIPQNRQNQLLIVRRKSRNRQKLSKVPILAKIGKTPKMAKIGIFAPGEISGIFAPARGGGFSAPRRGPPGGPQGGPQGGPRGVPRGVIWRVKIDPLERCRGALGIPRPEEWL